VHDGLAAALDEVQHGSAHAEGPGKLLGRLRSERVAFTIAFSGPQWVPEVRDGIATRRQQWLALPRDAKAEADLDDWRRTEHNAGAIADELRAQVALFGKAFADAHLDRMTCNQATQQAAAHLLSFDRPELREALAPELGRAQVLLRRVARASQANLASESVATGMLAAYQAAAAHDHPEALDEALAALRGTLDTPTSVPESEIDEAVGRALHEEARRLVALAADAPGDRSAALYLAMPDGVAAPQAAARRDEVRDPLRVLDAMYRVTQGDYRAAVEEVAGYVPGPLGGVLAAARARFGSQDRPAELLSDGLESRP
jgi:hypothetical protein